MAVESPTVCIMQPYFIPYAGYFRLMAACDLFVIYDCVQFPRRGYVHRNNLKRQDGKAEWLSLPLASCARQTLIRELTFRDDRREWWAAARRRFPVLADPGEDARVLVRQMQENMASDASPLDLISALLAATSRGLGFKCAFLSSSTLGIPETVKGEARIIEIAKSVGAKRYVNAPGGRALYDQENFAKAGIELRFLTDYDGSTLSILERVHAEGWEALSGELGEPSLIL